MPVFRQGLSRRFGRGFQGSRVRLVRLNSPPMVERSTGGRDPNHSDKRNLIIDEFRDKPARGFEACAYFFYLASIKFIFFKYPRIVVVNPISR